MECVRMRVCVYVCRRGELHILGRLIARRPHHVLLMLRRHPAGRLTRMLFPRSPETRQRKSIMSVGAPVAATPPGQQYGGLVGPRAP